MDRYLYSVDALSLRFSTYDDYLITDELRKRVRITLRTSRIAVQRAFVVNFSQPFAQ